MTEEKIKDIELYNSSMSKSMADKLFFIDKIPQSNYLFVDFGCANGLLLGKLKDIYPESIFLGYDCSEEMINLAKQENPGISFTTSWKQVQRILQSTNTQKVLILSSVIHEVYSYAKTKQTIQKFWQKVLNNEFDYIIIRDMLPDLSISRPAAPEDIEKVKNHEETKQQLKDFIAQHGKIEDNQNLVHFLLKYRYKTNWEREVREDYFPLYLGTIKLKVIWWGNCYKFEYLEQFVVPYIKEQVKKDFDIELKDATHAKIILKRR